MAAEQGNANAQNNLGEAYYNGEGVAKDTKEAVRWFRMAADQGDADAQNNLGVAYWAKAKALPKISKRGGALVAHGGGAGRCKGAK